MKTTNSDTQDYLIALQIAFDLASSATQEFLHKVRSHLPPTTLPYINGSPDDGDPKCLNALPKSFAQFAKILSREITIGMNLDFLFRTNNTDVVILNKIRDSLDSRNSIFHTAVSLANAYMYAGTTIDSFIRDNLEWLGKAMNWSKFTATAALGVIHRGHLSQGMTLLEPYLPGSSGTSSPYAEGGSLFGLGLIFANHGLTASKYLLQQLQDANDEVVQHGAALGLGVAGMATADESNFPS